MSTLKLSLAGKDYEIKELTCGQIEDIQELIGGFTQGGAVSISKEINRAIIVAALSVDHPDVTRESVRSMRFGTFRRISDAVREILRFAGFVEGPKSGETVAGAE